MPHENLSVGLFLVLGFIPDNDDLDRDGVHTPLRSDGYYGAEASAEGVAALWRQNRLHSQERIVVVKIVSDDDSVAGGGDGL